MSRSIRAVRYGKNQPKEWVDPGRQRPGGERRRTPESPAGFTVSRLITDTAGIVPGKHPLAWFLGNPRPENVIDQPIHLLTVLAHAGSFENRRDAETARENLAIQLARFPRVLSATLGPIIFPPSLEAGSQVWRVAARLTGPGGLQISSERSQLRAYLNLGVGADRVPDITVFTTNNYAQASRIADLIQAAPSLELAFSLAEPQIEEVHIIQLETT